MSKPLRVLLVEDSEDDALLLVDALRVGGYQPEYERVYTPEAMAAALSRREWDVVLCDYVMPRFSGLDALKLLQQTGQDIPFIMVSGKAGEETAVEAMHAGAHDYILKTNLTHLVPAIERELREVETRRERQRAERLLRTERDRAQRYLDVAGVMFVALDAVGRVTLLNRKGSDLLGFSEAELVGKDWFELAMPDRDRERVRATFLQLMRGEVEPVEYFENPVLTHTGEERLIAWHNTVLRDESGRVTGTLSSGEDITERRRAEDALRGSGERLARSQAIAHLGSWELDLITNHLTWSDEVYRIFGLQPQEFAATYEAFLEHVHPDDRAAADAAYTGSLREGRDGYEIEHRVVRHATGEVRVVHEKCEHIRDSSGRIIRSVGMVHDITERKAAEEALRESQERYQTLFDSIDEGFCIIEVLFNEEGVPVDYRFLEVNPAFERQTGLHDAVGKRMRDLAPSHDEYWFQTYGKVALTGEPARFENLAKALNRWYDVYAFRFGKPESRTVAVLFNDISDRKRAEERQQLLSQVSLVLASSLDYGKTLDAVAHLAVPHLADYCIVDLLDADGSVRQVAVAHVDPSKEETVREIWGLRPYNPNRTYGVAEVLRTGKPELVAAVSTDLKQLFAEGNEAFAARLETLASLSYMIVPLTARGRTIGALSFVAAESKRHYDKENLAFAEEVARRSAVAIDNARLHQEAVAARAEAEATAARVRAVQSITDVALARLEPGKLYQALLGRLREEICADTVVLLGLDQEQGVLQVRATVGLGGEALDEVQIPLGKGVAGRIAASKEPLIVEDVAQLDPYSPWLRERIHSLAGMPLIVGDQVVGVLHVGMFTHRRFSEDDTQLLKLAASRIALAVDRADLFEAERQARAEAEEANAAKDQFVAMISHELRNPLAAIQAGVELLRRELPQEGRVGRVVEIITRNTAMQSRLVNDLLDLSRIARGKMQFQRAPVLLGKAVCAAVEDQQGEAERAGVELKIDIESELWVQGDFERLQQVILNLLSNALKFTPAGGKVCVCARQVGGKGRIIVEDTGIGIDQALLEHLFVMFQQGEIAGQRQPGLGLGLALVKSITEKHGGRVWAESEGPGKGSRFTVELPLVSGPPTTPTAGQQARRNGPIRLLLVEDNADTLTMLDESLRRDGYEVRAAASAEEALALLKQWRPEVILSDIGLPGLNGYEFLHRARQMPGMEGIPAFAVTGYGTEEDVRRAREAGYAGHFVKPVNLATLDERIREWVGWARQR